MTTNGKNGDGPKGKGVVLQVPFYTAAFLDVVCRYTPGTKQSLYERIWSAGIAEVFGITEEELTECLPQFLPPDVEVPRDDLRKLTDMICGE